MTLEGAASRCPAVEDGRIAEDWTASDDLTLPRRLGLRRGLALGVRQAFGRLPG